MKSVNSAYYFSRLDHLRFYAAVLVMFQHGLSVFGASEALKAGSSPDFFAVWVEHGRAGVSLFLVLSGFLFMLIAKAGEHQIQYGKFIYNRFLRIFPLLIVVFFMLLTAGRGVMQGTDILNLLFLQLNIGHPVTGFGQEILPVGVMWTIAVEFQFYLIFPFLVLFYKKNGLKYLLGLILVMIGLRFILFSTSQNAYWNLYHSLIGRLDQFLIGMILGAYYINRVKQHFKNPVWLVGIFLVFTYLLRFETNDVWNGVIGFPIEGLLWGLIILSYMDIKVELPSVVDKTLSRLGELSFSIYLLHLLILASIRTNIGITPIVESIKLNAVLNTVLIGLPITIIFSMLTYTFIEKPFMDFRKPYLLKNGTSKKVA